jgi:hypothetical protein
MRNFLGGIPDEVSKTANIRVTNGTWLTALAAWNWLMTFQGMIGYGINFGTQKKGNILDWRITGGLFQVAVDNFGDWNDNDKVRVSRSIMEPDMNGLWKITKVSPNWLQLAGSTTTLTALSYQPTTGQVLGQAKGTSAIVSVEQIRLTKHNPGRPFGIARGRSRRKRRQIPLIPQAA